MHYIYRESINFVQKLKASSSGGTIKDQLSCYGFGKLISLNSYYLCKLNK